MLTFSPGLTAPDRAHDNDFWFLFHDAVLLVAEDGEGVRLPLRADLGRWALTPQNSHYLGDLEGQHCFAAELPAEAELPQGRWQNLRSLFGQLDDTHFALAGRAAQILEWDGTHRFCGRCGSATQFHTSERSRVCPSCGLTHYPRLSPAVMMLIRRGNELLLARSPRFPPDMFSALAGFVEPGETLEETVRRETREEVGVEVTNLRYFGSQPWPFPHSLMIAFAADYAGGELTPQPGEIEAVDWFPIDRLPRLPHRISIARKLIDATVREIAGAG
ncbi:NAD(+) diphosphatase [Azoarcus sp. KH32C]|uniref:NAD(+) diphosphatase n=1 Tax=Azoarcus sp. KH32C TaxID=748247 RepID=UPI0002387003|nr:NAD(+) diphosphatase [Azoarcus sp. KH32C]BAL24478.1 NTP pyrophosphohydrolase [Azoarcus sp. KH32C]